MSAADEIKARLDIVSYVQQYVPLKKAGRTFKACCPFHSEKTPSFVVNPDRQTWRCFGACATGGDVITFAMKYQNWSFGEALRELGKMVGVEVEPQSAEQKAHSERLDILRGLLKAIAEAYHHHLLAGQDANAAAALQYVREKRGFSDETIEKYQIGYAPDDWRTALDYLKELGYNEDDVIEAGVAGRSEQGRVYDRFRHRLMIPIRDDRGRVVGFGARALKADDNPKYLNSPQTPLFDKSRLLFGLDMAKRAISDSETAVIVEGYMDAISAHQAGFSNVVARMGTAMTEHQLRLIAPRMAKKIILALDSDAAGQSATRRGLEVARETLQADYSGRLAVDIRVLQIPDAKDPDDLIRETPEKWAALVEEALPVADFAIAMETAALPANASLQEREAAARRLLPILLASENNLYSRDNLQKLALRLHIMERDLLALAEEQQRVKTARPPKTDLEAPELPPLDYEAMMPAETMPKPQPPARRVASNREVALEMDCLRGLFLNPGALYLINRKFRELAGDDAALAAGPLCDLDGQDFSRGDHCALMETFAQALRQDEFDPLDYLRSSLEPALLGILDSILIDDLDQLGTRLRYSPEDLLIVRKQSQRSYAPVDHDAELVRQALKLRNRRLQREREELYFLHVEAQISSDYGLPPNVSKREALSARAKALIDSELKITPLR